MSRAKVIACAIACALSGAASADITFEDTSASTGVNATRYESWGASWGDFNGDGHPDLFMNNHRNQASLWQNNGDGSFTDVSLAVDVLEGWVGDATLNQDNHGAAWGDVDNDGDLDLFMSGNQEWFYLNDGGNLKLSSLSYGFRLNENREGASAAWMDYNNDGFLDMKIAHRNQRGIWKQELDGTFRRRNDGTMQCDGSNQAYTVIGNLNSSGLMDAICGDAEFPLAGAIHEMQNNQDFLKIEGFPISKPVRDVALADFNGDGLIDLFGIQSTMRPSDAVLVNDNRVEAQLSVTFIGEKGVRVKTTGELSVRMDWNKGFRRDVYIGADGHSPSSYPNFTLDPADVSNHGIRDRADGDEEIMSIGYDPTTEVWEFALRAGGLWQYTYLAIDSTQPMTIEGFDGQISGDLETAPVYFLNSPSGLVAASGFDPIQCVSVAAGDFDNDMDQDLYVACRGGAQNTANKVFENLGDGTFAEVANAGGAAGPIGAAVGPTNEGAGTSDSATVVDYDGDGWLDVFVSNGLNMRPKFYGGQNSLFRNTGSGNNWLELDLVGVMSNRSAVGATVTMTTPDGTVQVREQNGGYHRWSQNHTRIHFGMGSNDTADIRIDWPDGWTDEYTDVAAGAIMVATEADPTLAAFEYKQVKPYKCGMPDVDVSVDSGLFIWKRCADAGIWELRMTSDIDPMYYDGGVFVTSGSVSNVKEKLIESPDVFNPGNGGDITFNLETASAGFDGFTFEMPDPDADACLDVRTSQRVDIMVGPERRIFRGPFDLNTLEPCTGLPNTGGPVIAAVANQSTERGDAISLQIDATDVDGDWPMFAATNLPPGVTIDVDSGVISGSSSVDGDYAVTVTADDSHGIVETANFTWSITAPVVPPPPPPPAPRSGGGQIGWFFSLLLLLPLVYRRRRVSVLRID